MDLSLEDTKNVVDLCWIPFSYHQVALIPWKLVLYQHGHCGIWESVLLGLCRLIRCFFCRFANSVFERMLRLPDIVSHHAECLVQVTFGVSFWLFICTFSQVDSGVLQIYHHHEYLPTAVARLLHPLWFYLTANGLLLAYWNLRFHYLVTVTDLQSPMFPIAFYGVPSKCYGVQQHLSLFSSWFVCVQQQYIFLDVVRGYCRSPPFYAVFHGGGRRVAVVYIGFKHMSWHFIGRCITFEIIWYLGHLWCCSSAFVAHCF